MQLAGAAQLHKAQNFTRQRVEQTRHWALGGWRLQPAAVAAGKHRRQLVQQPGRRLWHRPDGTARQQLADFRRHDPIEAYADLLAYAQAIEQQLPGLRWAALQIDAGPQPPVSIRC